MKVLKAPRHEWHIEHECTGYGMKNPGCGAILDVELLDLVYYTRVYTMNDDSLESTYLGLGFECPCCKGKTLLGLNDYPIGWKQKLKEGTIKCHQV